MTNTLVQGHTSGDQQPGRQGLFAVSMTWPRRTIVKMRDMREYISINLIIFMFWVFLIVKDGVISPLEGALLFDLALVYLMREPIKRLLDAMFRAR
ncbi:hypothetical protein [Paenibacillus sp. UNC496MF]|uniref:hypothetical protein n=1 Tax=Paenibacillus sp. UNC496MF TaxID=1502753 RepID=UPI001C431273|nr:hypothetical protein [Paenibacillus sp. UNC496MF]